MRNLLALLGLVVVVVLGLGWYLDWYSFRPTPVPVESGRKTYTIDINTKKIGEDVRHSIREGEERLQDFFDQEPAPASSPAEKKPSTDKSKDSKPRSQLGDMETAEPGQPWRFK